MLTVNSKKWFGSRSLLLVITCCKNLRIVVRGRVHNRLTVADTTAILTYCYKRWWSCRAADGIHIALELLKKHSEIETLLCLSGLASNWAVILLACFNEARCRWSFIVHNLGGVNIISVVVDSQRNLSPLKMTICSLVKDLPRIHRIFCTIVHEI